MTTTPSGTNLWVEPESAATVEHPPQYPYNHITQTESGHSFELDDTPSRERIRLQHRSKTFMEMHPNGDEVHKIVGDGYEIIAGKKNVLIRGTCNITVQGDCNMQVLGDYNHQVNGDYNLVVKGKTNVRSAGKINILGDSDISIAADENFGGALTLSAASALNLGSDLYVGGSITCDTLMAESRVSGGMGVTAGPEGFTSGFGGLSLGFPTPVSTVATPGSITVVGTIFAALPITSTISVNAGTTVNAGISVNAPLVKCGVLNARLMHDSVNSKIFRMHMHISGSAGAPTSPSLLSFV